MWLALATTNTPLAGLDPAIHVSMQAEAAPSEDVDGRAKPGQGVILWFEGVRGPLNGALKAKPDSRRLSSGLRVEPDAR